MTPDANGKIKGISVPALPPSMEDDRSNLNVSSIAGAGARENSPVGAAQTRTATEIRHWEEARFAAMRKHLVQVEQDED